MAMMDPLMAFRGGSFQMETRLLLALRAMPRYDTDLASNWHMLHKQKHLPISARGRAVRDIAV